MSTLAPMLGRRALIDYARRPLNLVLLVVVPVVLVFVWGGTLADYSRLWGGTGSSPTIEAATAGWAASALAGLAGFFQVTGSREADRRLASATGRTGQVLVGRLVASLGLAVLAAVGGLAALAVRTGITDPLRVIAATSLITIIYLAIGILVGTTVRSEMNGALIVTLVWVFDVFFGPLLGPSSSPVTRVFPLHYPTLMLIGQDSSHAGLWAQLGWTLAWVIGLSALAVIRLAAIIRPHPNRKSGSKSHIVPAAFTDEPTPQRLNPTQCLTVEPSRTRRLRSGMGLRVPAIAVLVAGFREHRRNRILWVLLVVVPVIFIGMAIVVTVTTPGPITLNEGSRHYVALVSERRIHAAIMVPVTSAFLSGIIGLFVVTGSVAGDHRLVQAGFAPRQVLGGRLVVIGAASAIATLVAVGVSAAWYPPQQWAIFVIANLLIGLTYALIGALVGPITGRLGGLYLVLLLAFVDVGLGQSVMTPGGPPAWGAFLPARGATRVMIDGAFTARFDEVGYLLVALAWLGVTLAVTAIVFRFKNAPSHLGGAAKAAVRLTQRGESGAHSC